MSETNDEAGVGPEQHLSSDEAASAGAESTEPAHDVDLEALAAEDGDDEEEGLDVSDLDRLGVDGVVAQLRNADDFDADAALERTRPRRSPVISVLVVAFGAYLLVTMFADFRYWIRSSEPVDLGDAATLLDGGRTLEAYDDQFVVLQGTPDVQNAARLTTSERIIGYLRVTEGGGGLFAAVPRGKDQPVTNNFEGRYRGRLRRLEDDRAFEWLSQFYAQNQVIKEVDLDPAKSVAQLGSGDAWPTVAGGTTKVELDDEVRLIFEGPDARVQLGTSSFDNAEAAEKVVAGLGYPYLQLEATNTFYRFVVRIPPGKRKAAQQALNTGLSDVEGTTDPKVGAFVLALPLNYGAEAGQVARDGDNLVFPLGDNVTSPGYELKGDRLAERPRTEMVRWPADQLRSLRLERSIEVDPRGFVVAVGEEPSEQRRAGILWLVVLGITLANVGSLVLWTRRRAA